MEKEKHQTSCIYVNEVELDFLASIFYFLFSF